VDSKCFEMLIGAIAICDLLILVERLCFDRYKIDYTSMECPPVVGKYSESSPAWPLVSTKGEDRIPN
jgi:hypothetical protein